MPRPPWVFPEPRDLRLVRCQGKRPKTTRRLRRHQRGLSSLSTVEGHFGRDVHIADPITVGHAEGFVANVAFDPFDTSTGHRIGTCVNQRDPPGLDIVSVNFELVLPQVICDIRPV